MMIKIDSLNQSNGHAVNGNGHNAGDERMIQEIN